MQIEFNQKSFLKVGILAHSPDGAALAFKNFCHLGQSYYSDGRHPPVSLDYIPMGEAIPYWRESKFEQIWRLLERSIQNLKDSGCDFFFCPDNTAHVVLNERIATSPIPGLNFGKVLVEAAQLRAVRKILFVGTKFSVNNSLYKNRFASAGLALIPPNPKLVAEVHSLIFDELCFGIVSDRANVLLQSLVSYGLEHGCDCLLLGCTELSLLDYGAIEELEVLASNEILTRRAFLVAIGQMGLNST